MPQFPRSIHHFLVTTKLCLRRLRRARRGLLSLPPELILIIVDALKLEDAACLAVCCRSLRNLVAAARPKLLRSLTKVQHSLLFVRLAFDLNKKNMSLYYSYFFPTHYFCEECTNLHSSYERVMRCFDERQVYVRYCPWTDLSDSRIVSGRRDRSCCISFADETTFTYLQEGGGIYALCPRQMAQISQREYLVQTHPLYQENTRALHLLPYRHRCCFTAGNV